MALPNGWGELSHNWNARVQCLNKLPRRVCLLLGVEWIWPSVSGSDALGKDYLSLLGPIEKWIRVPNKTNWDLVEQARPKHRSFISDIIREIADSILESIIASIDIAYVAEHVAFQEFNLWEWLYKTYSDALGEGFVFNPSWRTNDVTSLVQRIYDNREWDLMPILTDALQDAGCNDQKLINHLNCCFNFTRADWILWNVLDLGS